MEVLLMPGLVLIIDEDLLHYLILYQLIMGHCWITFWLSVIHKNYWESQPFTMEEWLKTLVYCVITNVQPLLKICRIHNHQWRKALIMFRNRWKSMAYYINYVIYIWEEGGEMQHGGRRFTNLPLCSTLFRLGEPLQAWSRR